MLNVRNFQNQLANGGDSFNLTYQTNLKSVQSILSVMTNELESNSGSVSRQAIKELSQSTFNKNQLSYYRFRIGGEQYPQYGNVDTSLANSSEAWKQLQLALGTLGVETMTPSISNYEWRSATSDKFVMSMLMAKEKDIYNTGADAVLNYIEHEIKLGAGVGSNQTLHTFINFDQVLVLSRQQGARLYY